MILMSATEARRQWYVQLKRVEEERGVLLITEHGKPTTALVPFEAARGHMARIQQVSSQGNCITFPALKLVRIERK